MTPEQLLQEACELCEEYSEDTSCEYQGRCPVYKLYLATRAVKYDNWQGCQGNCDFEQQPKPEMI